MTDGATASPTLRLEAREVSRVAGGWRVHWRVVNEGREPVRLVAVRAPHSRFRSEPVDLNLVVADTAGVDQTVSVAAAPGERVENAFVIFVAVVDRQTWRVMFRVRVPIHPDGTPAPIVESMTMHRIGFSEV